MPIKLLGSIKNNQRFRNVELVHGINKMIFRKQNKLPKLQGLGLRRFAVRIIYAMQMHEDKDRLAG